MRSGEHKHESLPCIIDVQVMSDDLPLGTNILYVRVRENKLAYSLRITDALIIRDKEIPLERLKIPEPLDLNSLRAIMPKLLDITYENGHTQCMRSSDRWKLTQANIKLYVGATGAITGGVGSALLTGNVATVFGVSSSLLVVASMALGACLFLLAFALLLRRGWFPGFYQLPKTASFADNEVSDCVREVLAC